MRVTGTAQRDAWVARTWPPVEEVRADLWSIPVPIPDNPLRYTLTCLLAAGSQLVVVDPGWDTEAGWIALADGLKAAGASPAGVTGIVVTHIHPDHHGLSARLRDASGACQAGRSGRYGLPGTRRGICACTRRQTRAGQPGPDAAGASRAPVRGGDRDPGQNRLGDYLAVTRELTWSRGWASVTGFMRRAALAEAGAHLRHLVDGNRVTVAAPGEGRPELYALGTSGRQQPVW